MFVSAQSFQARFMVCERGSSQLVEDCETGIVAETRRRTTEGDQQLQSHSLDVGDVFEVVCHLCHLAAREGEGAGGLEAIAC